MQRAVLLFVRIVNVLAKHVDESAISLFREADNFNVDNPKVADVASLVRGVADRCPIQLRDDEFSSCVAVDGRGGLRLSHEKKIADPARNATEKNDFFAFFFLGFLHFFLDKTLLQVSCIYGRRVRRPA